MPEICEVCGEPATTTIDSRTPGGSMPVCASHAKERINDQHALGVHKNKRLPDLIQTLTFWSILGCGKCAERLTGIRKLG